MTDTTYYAWAPIMHKNADLSDASIMPGDVVPSDLLDSIDKETKATWIADGVIRKAVYPKDVPSGLSVRTHVLRKANEAFESAQKIGSPSLDPQAENVKTVTPAGEAVVTPAVVEVKQGDGPPQQ